MTRVIFIALAFLAVCTSPAAAQESDKFPAGPIKLIVPYPPGAGTDQFARMVAERMSVYLKTPVVVDNRSGAGGGIGTSVVNRSRPDGYTLLFTGPGPMGANKYLMKDIDYDPAKMSPISLIGGAPMVILARPNFEAKSLSDLVTMAKAAPSRYSFASGGVGSASHLTTELLEQVADVKLTHVPYRGNSPALNDLLGGYVDIFVVDLPSTLGQNLSTLAVTSAKRSPLRDSVPTAAEQGIDVLSATWWAIVGPPELPAPVVEKLNKSISDALSVPELRATLEARGLEILGGTPEDARRFIADEDVKWKKVIERAGINAQ